MLQALDQPGAKRADVEAHFGVSHGTLGGFLAKRADIEKHVKMPTALDAKSSRQTPLADLDAALLEWFRNVRAVSSDVSLTGPDIGVKAEQIVGKLRERNVEGYEDAVVDMSWVDRWKKRHSISRKLIVGESASADHGSANDWLSTQVAAIRREFSDDDIFNADETGLFWKMSPDRTLAFRGEVCKGGKHAKDRITLLVAASAKGEKLPLFAIGKSKRPHCFRGVLNLPVKYEANAKAWMNSELFEQWCRQLNATMKARNRKIALILDNFCGHPLIELSNIKMFFLPPNTTSLTQPMDAGIIKNLKHFYHWFLVKTRLACIDSGTEFKINLLQALEWAKQAWVLVKPETIQHCYAHVGFTSQEGQQQPVANEEEGDDELWEAAQRSGLVVDTVSFQDFVSVDDGVMIGAAANGQEIDDILDCILPAPELTDADSDDEPVEVAEEVPKFEDAMKGLQTALRYLRSIPSSEVHCLALTQAREHCMDQRVKSMKQKMITSFFGQPKKV